MTPNNQSEDLDGAQSETPRAQYDRIQHLGTGPQVQGPYNEADRGNNGPHATNALHIVADNKGWIAMIIGAAIIAAALIFLGVNLSQHRDENQM